MKHEPLFPFFLIPNLDFFKLLLNKKIVFLEAFENFSRQTFRNRFEIAAANGVQKLVVPIEKSSMPKVLMKDVRISYDEDWQRKHWRAIVSAYNSSPFFLYYQDEFKAVFKYRYEKLVDFNLALLKLFINLLSLGVELKFTTSFDNPVNANMDFRYQFEKKNKNLFQIYPPYYQVFKDKNGFIENLSIIDLLFNLGPESKTYLHTIK